MFTVKSFSKSMAFCAVVALSQLSTAHAMDPEIPKETKTPAKLITFTAEDVVNHVKNRPEQYNMQYLESEEGKKEIQNFITEYNAGVLGVGVRKKCERFQEDEPDSKYNMSVIAFTITLRRFDENLFQFSEINGGSTQDLSSM